MALLNIILLGLLDYYQLLQCARLFLMDCYDRIVKFNNGVSNYFIIILKL